MTDRRDQIWKRNLIILRQQLHILQENRILEILMKLFWLIVLQDLKEQSKELANILRHQIDFENKFMMEVKEELRDIKCKTNDIHMHCKESAQMVRDSLRRSDL